MVKKYVPHRGDIVWLSFDPQSGHEQRWRRPALIISDRLYNQTSSRAIVIPITSRSTRHPFELVLPSDASTKGLCLCDHIKNLDWLTRNATYIESVSEEYVAEVVSYIELLIHSR